MYMYQEKVSKNLFKIKILINKEFSHLKRFWIMERK